MLVIQEGLLLWAVSVIPNTTQFLCYYKPVCSSGFRISERNIIPSTWCIMRQTGHSTLQMLQTKHYWYKCLIKTATLRVSSSFRFIFCSHDNYKNNNWNVNSFIALSAGFHIPRVWEPVSQTLKKAKPFYDKLFLTENCFQKSSVKIHIFWNSGTTK